MIRPGRFHVPSAGAQHIASHLQSKLRYRAGDSDTGSLRACSPCF